MNRGFCDATDASACQRLVGQSDGLTLSVSSTEMQSLCDNPFRDFDRECSLTLLAYFLAPSCGTKTGQILSTKIKTTLKEHWPAEVKCPLRNPAL